ncbi:GLPGLI family protein [Dyadobacter psychrophilus]|uniref:GLPGLI family protein n=1 Tax=Dyadobacter psychrophilus TaxID=651661 RepID=A0A1T5E165_9BACT|nr:GLPGLI family protein [Dyadobacter psychrophilus]SKB77614.1 GLPGLI family protein [Dyadobacter psychrophilus]
MKIKILLAAMWLAAGQAYAQFSGQINYEIVRKIDPSQLRMVFNGEPVKPGDPNFPTDLPDSRTVGQKTLFSGNFAREIMDDQNTIVTRVLPDGGPPKTTNLGRPFDEYKCVDLAERKVITFLTMKGPEAKTYKSESQIEAVSGWQMSDQTKKIAGYQCKKAIVKFKDEPYAVWFTEDLPATYSPVQELTPEKGVVLLIEGTREQFRATKVQPRLVNPTDVEPQPGAQQISKEELTEMREKALADFRQQKMMPGDGGR